MILYLLTVPSGAHTFAPGSSNTWHRHRLSALREDHIVSRFLFEPVPGRGDLGRTSPGRMPQLQDRKSTRLNSSHSQISYAVFCLKKKKINNPKSMLQLNQMLTP